MKKGTGTHMDYTPAAWREIIPRLVEAFLLRTVTMKTAGSEANIPPEGTLITVFAPHSGWIESIVIDACFRMAGRERPYWFTKAANRSLPRIIAADRLFCVDRRNPEPSAIKSIYRFLQLPSVVLASSIEGEIFGNPQDPDDILTLGEFRTGMVRFAMKARVPILPVVVLGSAKVAPNLEQVWAQQGTLGAYRTVRQLMVQPPPIEIRFIPLYTDHLLENSALTGNSFRANIAFHTNQLRKLMVTQIVDVVPDYPVGS